MLSFVVALTFALLMVLWMTIAIVTGVSTLFVLILGNYPLMVLPQFLSGGIQKYSLLAIPFFILSGTFMTKGGIAGPLLNFADELLKWVKGGFAIAVMLACLIFSALSGASAAIAAALGIMAVPVMVEKRYPKRLSLGIHRCRFFRSWVRSRIIPGKSIVTSRRRTKKHTTSSERLFTDHPCIAGRSRAPVRATALQSKTK